MKRIFILALFILAAVFFSQSCQKAPFITLNTPKSFTFTRDGGTQSISFTCNRNWSVSSSESWIQVSPSSGSASDGEITVKITCAANTTYDARTATLTVKVEELTEAISISQDTGLGLLVSPKTFNLTNAAQTIEIEVQKNVQYSISIDDAGKDWVTHTGTKGLTSEKATFSIAANETYDNREAKITFKQTDGNLSETVVVKQSQTNGLFITPPEYDLSNDAHTLTVDVQANIDYEVSSDVDWIANTKATTKGLVNSQITLQVNANETYDDREGHVTVKQKGGELSGVITIRQDENYGIFVSKEKIDITNTEQKVEVEVKYNVDFEVVIPAEAMGTMILSVEYEDPNSSTKALSTRKYRFGIAENTDYDGREVSITFKQKDGSLSGTVQIKQAQKDGIIISEKEYKVGRDGDTIEIKLQSNVDYDVVIPDEAKSWIKQVESMPTKGLVDSSIYLEIAENATYYNREAGVTINQKGGEIREVVTIQQAQTDALFITNETKEFNIPSKGGSVELLVFHNVLFEFDKNTIPEWLDIMSEALDEYNTKISIAVLPNNEYIGREVGLSLVAGKLSDSFTIHQHQIDIVYTDISEYSANWKGGDFTLKVYSNVEYNSTIPDWIVMQSESTTKEGYLNVTTISYTVNENLDYAREENIVFSWYNEGIEGVTSVLLKQECCTITLSNAGTLLETITTDRVNNIRVLVLNGDINGDDVIILKRMSSLYDLNLKGSSIKAGGNPYGNYYGVEYYTEDNVIGRWMFDGMISFKKVVLPNTVTIIGGASFRSCDNLEEIIIGDNVKTIEFNAFIYSYKLKDVKIPEGVLSIGTTAFAQCAIETITLPSTLTTIDSGAFGGCPIKEIHIKAVPTTLKNIGTNVFSDSVYDEAILYLPKGTKEAYYYSDFGRFKTIVEE